MCRFFKATTVFQRHGRYHLILLNFPKRNVELTNYSHYFFKHVQGTNKIVGDFQISELFVFDLATICGEFFLESKRGEDVM